MTLHLMTRDCTYYARPIRLYYSVVMEVVALCLLANQT